MFFIYMFSDTCELKNLKNKEIGVRIKRKYVYIFLLMVIQFIDNVVRF